MSDLLASLKQLPRSELARISETLPEEQASELLYWWEFWARPEQLIPAGDWTTWLVMAGRGFGKTRVLSEAARTWIKTNRYVNMIGATADDARDILIEGESGILACCPKHERPLYKKSERKLLWPNGATSLIFTADEPERLRGKQHMKLLCDEVAAWRYPDAWTQARLGLRLGKKPQCIVATTPRPRPLVRELLDAKTTLVTRGSTYDNSANLAQDWLDTIITQYEGTRLGRQELDGQLLTDTPGALWKIAQFDECRVPGLPSGVKLVRVVVAVDPAVSSSAESDETGIVVVGLGSDGFGYVLADYSGQHTPQQWASKVVEAYREHQADCVVVEVNQGGDLVSANLRSVDANLPIRTVHASRGKVLRAEPIASLYEQLKVRHLKNLGRLEDQMSSWSPVDAKRSPDRLDACVYGLTEVMLGGAQQAGITQFARGSWRR